MEDSDYRQIIGEPPLQVSTPMIPIWPRNCADARKILEKSGYALDKRLVVTVPTRLGCPDAAVMFIRG
jgi:hypothetical protein